MSWRPWPSALLALASGAMVAAPGSAGAAEGEMPWKFTLGRYRLGPTGEPALGTDINLRRRDDNRTLWLGVYQDGQTGRQWRAGWDDQFPWAEAMGWGLQWQPSLQVASGGFVGGSLTLQAGAPVYVQLGLGRTNLRPYANLNFDPNDAVTVALGWQGEGGRQLSASVIADDRLHTRQQHHHLTLRWPLPEAGRLTVDLLHKQGLGDTGPVRAWGWTLGLDGTQWFGRLARDPRQNFSANDAWRLSVGRRF